MFKLLLQFVKPYYETDDDKYSKPIIYNKSKWL